MLKTKNSRLFISLCFILSAAIFTIDLFTPLGIADGVSYTIVIMLTIWIDSRRSTFIAAAATTMLTYLGMMWSPHGEAISIFATNRALALIAIWASAYVIYRFKKADAQATRDRDSLHALFEYATEGILFTDQSGKVIMANPQAEKQFGYEKGEMIGKPVESLMPTRFATAHVQKRDEYYQKPHERFKGTGMELVARKKDDTEFPVEISLSNYTLAGKLYVIAFVVDITRRKQQQDLIRHKNEELIQSAEELKRTNAELENFAYVSSHDLQEPLRKIQSFGDRLKMREGEKLGPEGKDYLDRMLNASARMQRLINDLLAFSRLTSQAHGFIPVDLSTIAKEVLSDLEVNIEKNKAQIKVDYLPPIEAEPTQMRQLFQNLLGNALKFRHADAHPVIRVHSEQARYPDKKQEYVRIFIEDNGIGFDEKYLDKIFSIFQRLDGQKYEGSGIGLAICKKIVSRHGGDITAKSAPGKGTSFIVTLPIQQKNSLKQAKELATL